MKTIQELYSEIMASEELKAKCIEAANAGKTEAFLKEHGCEATMEEVNAFLKAKAEEDAPLSMDELNHAAGGDCSEANATADAVAVASTFTGATGNAARLEAHAAVRVGNAVKDEISAPVHLGATFGNDHSVEATECENCLCN